MINKLSGMNLNCGIFSVYDFEGMSELEILCKFFEKINEVIENVNNVNDLVNWLKNEGLHQEVAYQLGVWLADGTLANLINKTIFDELNQKVNKAVNFINATYNLIDEGGKNDGVFDNKEIFENVINKMQDGESLYIPSGDFKIILNDSDLKDVPNMTYKAIHPWILKNNTNKIKIFGNGNLIIDSSNAKSKKASLIRFENCDDLTIEGITITGDVKFGVGLIINDNSLNGISVVNSNNVNINNIKMFNMLACLIISGDDIAPVTSYKTISNINISNCLFKDYGQISTFGGGASRLIYSNNIMINPLQCGIKLSSNVTQSVIPNLSNNIVISNNIVYWEKEFGFGTVSWSPGKIYVPTGIMSECHSSRILIENNLVDLSDVSINITPDTGIGDTGGIIIYKGSDYENQYNKDISILNNRIVGYRNERAIVASPYVNNFIIKGNILDGGIDGRTFSTITNSLNYFEISDNTFLSELSISLKNSKYNTININNNNANENTNNLILLDSITSDNFNILNNIVKGGSITKVTTLNINEFIIDNNNISQIDLDLNNNKYLSISNNKINSNNSAIKIVNNNNDSIIDFNNNSGIIGSGASILIVDNGNLSLIGNSFKTATGLPYSIGNCNIRNGIIKMQNEPTTLKAEIGVMYINLSVKTQCVYIKISEDNVQGSWKQI